MAVAVSVPWWRFKCEALEEQCSQSLNHDVLACTLGGATTHNNIVGVEVFSGFRLPLFVGLVPLESSGAAIKSDPKAECSHSFAQSGTSTQLDFGMRSNQLC